MTHVSLSLASRPQEPTLLLVKLQSLAWELNFRATSEALGHDEETWNVAVTVPIATVETIVAAVRAGQLGTPAS